MLGDIGTVVWKEWKEFLHLRGSIRATLFGQLWLLIFVSLYFAFLGGESWLDTAASLQLWCSLPMILVISIIPDSFAGERERHTLETLLASRLSESAILLGKVGAAVSYGCGLTILASLLSMVIVNLLHWQGMIHFYPYGVFLIGIIASWLIATLVASLGVLVSLQAATVRQAQQSLGLAIGIVTIIATVVLVPFSLKFHNFFIAKVTILNFTQLILAILVFFVLLDLLIIFIAIKRFQRTLVTLD